MKQIGAVKGIRTPDHMIKSHVLYQLSYHRKFCLSLDYILIIAYFWLIVKTFLKYFLWLNLLFRLRALSTPVGHGDYDADHCIYHRGYFKPHSKVLQSLPITSGISSC